MDNSIITNQGDSNAYSQSFSQLGRIIDATGAPFTVSEIETLIEDKRIMLPVSGECLMCGVIDVVCPGDSLAAVQRVDEEMALLMSYGMWVRVDVSGLCNTNAARAVSRFINTALECNGRLTVVISIDHPQLANVLKACDTKERLVVKVNDDFMHALESDGVYHYCDKDVDASVLWNMITRCNVIFGDACFAPYCGVIEASVNLEAHVAVNGYETKLNTALLDESIGKVMLLAAYFLRYKRMMLDKQIAHLDEAHDNEDGLLELRLCQKIREGVDGRSKCDITLVGQENMLRKMGIYLNSEEGDALLGDINSHLVTTMKTMENVLDNEDVLDYRLTSVNALVVKVSRSTRSDEVKQSCVKAWKSGCDELVMCNEDSRKQDAANKWGSESILKRPKELEADVVRFQNKKEKWIAFVGLIDGRPYEIFTGIADDEEGIFCPKSVNSGKIIKAVDENGQKRYDFQFINKRGFKTTIEGLSEKFNPEFWNYAKLISSLLRYGMPLESVVKLVSSLELDHMDINTWFAGVVKALKKYLPLSEVD